MKEGVRLTYENQLRVLYLVSYEDLHLRELIHKASEEVRVVPIFADKEIRVEETILQTLRTLVMTCDIIVIVIDFVPAGMILETEFIKFLGKPLIIFARKPIVPFFHPRMRYLSLKYEIVYYRELRELQHLLVSSLAKLLSSLRRPEYYAARKEVGNLVSILEKTLKTNVLVLGKDSDAEGLEKINRIKTVLRSKGYDPVSLKDLPEIKHISLEGKMIRVGGLTRFVIAEDSRPSGHIDEVNICARCEYVTATVRVVGSASTWMQAHYPMVYTFMDRFCYLDNQPNGSRDSLCDSVYSTLEKSAEAAIGWAEEYIANQEKEYSKRIYSNF